MVYKLQVSAIGVPCLLCAFLGEHFSGVVLRSSPPGISEGASNHKGHAWDPPSQDEDCGCGLSDVASEMHDDAAAFPYSYEHEVMSEEHRNVERDYLYWDLQFETCDLQWPGPVWNPKLRSCVAATFTSGFDAWP